MSTILEKKIKISVTNGDALETNRIKGRSNTGTYFLCSLKDNDKFEEYINEDAFYHLDKEKLDIYKNIFMYYYEKNKEKYPNKMINFNGYANALIKSDEVKFKISLRKNDTRIFIRFDNSDPKVVALRNLLYAEITYICIEKRDEGYYIYPEVIINKTYIEG